MFFFQVLRCDVLTVQYQTWLVRVHVKRFIYLSGGIFLHVWVVCCDLEYTAVLHHLQAGQVMCRRMVCDCDNPNADLFCCPECDPRLSSQCLHQNGLLTYGSGDTWVENCQQCQCLVGPAHSHSKLGRRGLGGGKRLP